MAFAMFAVIAPLPASAGNIWLTGHDAELHCNGGSQCNHFGIALDFVRQNAPVKTKPVLFVTRGTQLTNSANSTAAKARNTIEGAGNPFPFVVVNPTTPAFATANFNDYSALVFTSSESCGGCDATPADIAAINLRTADIKTFFNTGGGLLYFAGSGTAVIETLSKTNGWKRWSRSIATSSGST